MFFTDGDIQLDDLIALCNQTADVADYAHAAGVEKNIVIYEGDRIREVLTTPAGIATIRSELARCLKNGPGVFVVKGAYPNTAVIEKTTGAFIAMIAAEKAAGAGQGDHFGSNERLWNAVQKACVYDPELFIDYYSNPILRIACEAWLGPHYQMTAQVNNVKPGGKAQSAHRDYHLGFQSAEMIAQYPAHMQIASQYLTLQGAIAHCDMPLETGPTLFLPFSQQLKAGYLAYTRPEFRAYFDEHHVQIPFGLGDMVFFSPALFHGAGTNISNRDRLANLVQVSSAFGRPMETVNRYAMLEAVYPALAGRKAAGTISEQEILDTLACVADGYSFPTNLDSDPPIGGNAPKTAAQITQEALNANVTWAALSEQLQAYATRRQA